MTPTPTPTSDGTGIPDQTGMLYSHFPLFLMLNKVKLKPVNNLLGVKSFYYLASKTNEVKSLKILSEKCEAESLTPPPPPTTEIPLDGDPQTETPVRDPPDRDVPRGQTNTCDNITLPLASLAGGNNTGVQGIRDSSESILTE